MPHVAFGKTNVNDKNVTWFCVRSRPKHEHIAAAHLRKMDDVEVFLPRIRFKRGARRGMVWVTEALFPGYLFAGFDWQVSLRRVQSANGVQGVVHFGGHWPVIPEEIIADLRQVMGTTDLHTISPEFSPGDAVQITEGTLRGLQAVVSHVMPSRERVAVLMELLGRQVMVEIKTPAIVKEGNKRTEVFRESGNSSPGSLL
jgi:transcriptional antiterminator RfaH